MKKQEKTNVMRLLEKAKISFTPLYYDLEGAQFSGMVVAELTGVSQDCSFKTLTARSDKGEIAVFLIPVNRELHLKKAAAAAGYKSISMLHVKELQAITGYQRGEVSPVGMKKSFPVFIDSLAQAFSEIVCSAGKKGYSVMLSPQDLAGYVHGRFTALTQDTDGV